MNEPIDNTQRIDVFIKRIDDCIQYADDGEVPFMPEQMLQTVYHAVSTSSHYNHACKIWRKEPSAAKTWALFKSYFAEEYHDLKEQQRLNMSQTNFHRANSVLYISSALDNLAMVVTTDQDIMAQLIQSNKQLVEMNTILTAQLKSVMETNNNLIKKPGNNNDIASRALLLKKVSYADALTPKSKPYHSCAPSKHAKGVASLDPHGYCWSHGYRVQVGHNSKDCCKGKLRGHQDDATRADTKGGATKGKDKMWRVGATINKDNK